MRATVKLSSGAAADSETWVTGTARVEQEFAG